MKATGMTRSIDSLGRVVIPKEIRRTLHFREGDPLEIFTESDGSVVLKKYSTLGNVEECAKEFAESLHHTLGETALITDRDTVVAVSGKGKKDLLGKSISGELSSKINGRRGILTDKKKKVDPIPLVFNDYNPYYSQCILPILGSGDVLGAVVISSEEKSLDDIAYKNAETCAYFLGECNV